MERSFSRAVHPCELLLLLGLLSWLFVSAVGRNVRANLCARKKLSVLSFSNVVLRNYFCF